MLAYELKPGLARHEYEYLNDFLTFLLFLDEEGGPIAQQIDRNYQHGGGWRPLAGWKFNPETHEAQYPGDPRMSALAWVRIGEERLFLFPYSWALVLQPDGSFEMARLD